MFSSTSIRGSKLMCICLFVLFSAFTLQLAVAAAQEKPNKDSYSALPLNRPSSYGGKIGELNDSSATTQPATRQVISKGRMLLLISADRTSVWAYVPGSGGWAKHNYEQPLTVAAKIELGEKLIVIAENNSINAFSSISGEWRELELDEPLLQPPTISGNLVFASTTSRLHVFSAESTIWSHVETPNSIEASADDSDRN